METRFMAKRRKIRESEAAQFTGSDLINNLPDECLTQVFSYLPVEDKLKLTAVCGRWRQLEHEIWRGVKHLNLSGPEKWKTQYKRILALCGRQLENLTISVAKRSNIIRMAIKYCHNLIRLKVQLLYYPGSDAHCLDVAKLFLQNKMLRGLNMEHRQKNPSVLGRCHIVCSEEHGQPKLWVIQVDEESIRICHYRYTDDHSDDDD